MEKTARLNHLLLSNNHKECEIIEIIPEWGRLIGCKQHAIHDYPLDEHTLLVIKKLQESEEFKQLADNNKLILLYAALLHDIEKKEGEIDPDHPNRGAEKAKEILYRLEFGEHFTNKVYILIKYHIVLGIIAAGRPKFTIEELAEIYKDSEVLDLQKILAIADIKSVKKNEAFFNDGMGERIEEIVKEIKNNLSKVVKKVV